jgi:hypothetical protein
MTQPPYQPPPGSWAVPPNPQHPGRPQRRPVKVGRVFAGLGIAIAAHLLTLVAPLVGLVSRSDDVIYGGLWIGLGGQVLVFLACLVVGIILTVRQDGGIGVGLLIGWAVGVLIVPVLGFGLCVAAFEMYN